MHNHTHNNTFVHFKQCADEANCWCREQRLLQVLGVSALILVAELIGGLYSGSLALLADAVHVFGDNIAIIVVLLCTIAPKYGFETNKANTVGFNTLIALLIVVVLWILYESVERLQNPNDIRSVPMIVVAFFGGLGNIVQHKMLQFGDKNEMTLALLLHISSDALQSAVIVLGGIVILMTDWHYIDPILSFAIALYISYQIFIMVKNEKQKQN